MIKRLVVPETLGLEVVFTLLVCGCTDVKIRTKNEGFLAGSLPIITHVERRGFNFDQQ